MTTTTGKIGGVITALATPFQNGAIDEASLRRLIRRQLDEGVSGFVVNGTTGESPTLTRDEVRSIFDLCRAEVAGQVPILLGTGSNSTAATCEFSRQASTWGPDALLVVVPYYNKPPQRGLLEHFRATAAAASRPIYLYDVPSRTGAGLLPSTVAELSHVDGIAGIKDATGDLRVLSEMRRTCRSGFTFLSGDDLTCVQYARAGGEGVISVASHLIAREMKESLAAHAVVEFEKQFGDLMHHLYIEANPIPLKMALHWMGLFAGPELRLPLSRLDEKYHKDFRACLKQLGKI